MLDSRESYLSNDSTITCLGFELYKRQRLKIKRKLEDLHEKCPANSTIKLVLEKRRSCFVGKLTIKSVTKNFCSKMISHSPSQTYLLLEEDIEKMLNEWKLTRFAAPYSKLRIDFSTAS